MDQRFAASQAVAAARKVRSAAVAIPSAVDDLRGIVVRTISTARACGRDYIAQSHLAADAVARVRPDLTPLEVFDAVRRVRDLNAV
jgi:hypothetical protein